MVLRILAIFLIFFHLPSARAGIEFTEFFCLNLVTPMIHSNADSSVSGMPGATPGFGVTVNYDLFFKFALEGGLIYTNRGFSISSNALNASGGALNFTLHQMQLPILIRYRFTERLSVGLGAYYAHGLGNADYSQGGQENAAGYTQQNWELDDYGLASSFKYRIALGELFHLAMEERVNVGFANIDYSGNGSLYFLDFQTWVGLSIDL